MTMLHARDSSNPASQEFTSCSPALTAYFSISGREWHNTPRIRSPVLTSACIYTQQNHNIFVRYHLFCVKKENKYSSHKIYSVEWLLRSEVGQATEEKGGSKNKQQVGQYGTEKGAFHHYDLAFMKSKERNDDLRHISKCCIQQATHCNRLMYFNYNASATG
jgi:hypothetical protein